MCSRDEKTKRELSICNVSRASQTTTGLTSTSRTRVPDFFAPKVFQAVLHNTTTFHQLLKFSQSRLCGENLEFLEKIEKYHSLLGEVSRSMFEIHRDYVSTNAPTQINIPESLLVKANKDVKSALSSILPPLESVFVDAQSDIEELIVADIYPQFIRYQVTASAARALTSDWDRDRARYAGLGDCFVLTDPSKPDNPIVFASDGFVKVTGYERNEIIPRSCRFLQNRHTDQATVRGIRDAGRKREESVEVILNQKKTGEPFWNLLYIRALLSTSSHGGNKPSTDDERIASRMPIVGMDIFKFLSLHSLPKLGNEYKRRVRSSLKLGARCVFDLDAESIIRGSKEHQRQRECEQGDRTRKSSSHIGRR
ncbi:hypothetical protein RBB50_004131 [Rhinocladiella similis]